MVPTAPPPQLDRAGQAGTWEWEQQILGVAALSTDLTNQFRAHLSALRAGSPWGSQEAGTPHMLRSGGVGGTTG